jgi:hypothetical protein
MDALKEDMATRSTIFYSILSTLVFTDTTTSDAPISSLTDQRNPNSRIIFVRPVVRFLVYLPVITICFLVALELCSMFLFESVFRFPHDALWDVWHGDVRNHLSEIIRAVSFKLLAIFIAIFTGLLCSRVMKFQQATTAVLREFNGRIQDPH